MAGDPIPKYGSVSIFQTGIIANILLVITFLFFAIIPSQLSWSPK
jgi:hypothetical protein